MSLIPLYYRETHTERGNHHTRRNYKDLVLTGMSMIPLAGDKQLMIYGMVENETFGQCKLFITSLYLY